MAESNIYPPTTGGGDSPLSTTGNITGLLTFALATFSFCLAFYIATEGALKEMDDYQVYLDQRKDHIAVIRQFFEERDIEADHELEISGLQELIRNSLKSAEERREKLEQEVGKIRNTPGVDIGKRIQWWMRRRDMSLATASVEIEIHHLTALQMSFIIR